MSAPSSATKKPIRPQGEGPTAELMRVLGARGYTAMPPDQHEWQKAAAEHNPPLHRLWSWMVHNTLTWGHTDVEGEKKAYATNKEGLELHLEHAAKDLKMDPANVRHAWREGVLLGLWRRGTAQEGKRKLYLCGKVAPPKTDSESTGEKVCTDLFGLCFQKLPPYVRDQILARNPDDVKRIALWYSRHAEIERVALADIMAAGRMVVGRIAEEGWRSLGIEVRRLDTEADEDRQARLCSLLPQVEQLVTTVAAKVTEPSDPATLAALEAQVGGAPAPSQVPRSVQTQNGSVQSSEMALYEPDSEAVQGEKTTPSLLPVPTTKRGQQAGSIYASGQRRGKGPQPISDGREAVQVHAGEARQRATMTTEEAEHAEKLLRGIADVWRKQPRKFAGELPNAEDAGHMATALKMVRAVGLEEVEEFLLYIEQKASGRSLGHQLTLALLSEIAVEFRSGAADRVRQREAAAAQFVKAQERTRAAVERRQQEDELVERVEAAWEGLSVGEQITRLRAAGEELKADPHWNSVYRHNETEKRRQMELRAKRRLRLEIEARGPDGTRASKD